MLEGHTGHREGSAPYKPPATALQQRPTQQTRLRMHLLQPFSTGIALKAFHQCRAMALA